MKSGKRLSSVILNGFLCALIMAAPAIARQTLTMIDPVRSADLSKTVPGQLSYQGSLADAADSSAVTAVLEMTFRIFDTETDGTELWSETHPTIQVANGLFQVLLGDITSFPAGLFDGSPLWLQTEVGTQVLAPRKPLVSVAYSQRAEAADHASTADWAADAQSAVRADTAEYCPGLGAWTVSGDDVYRETGKVGIGTTSPLTELDVAGAVNATTYYGDGSHLTGISGTTDNDWTIDGDNVYHLTGNVGIGTSNPLMSLDVSGSMTRLASGLIVGQATVGVPGIHIFEDEVSPTLRFTNYSGISSTSSIQFVDNTGFLWSIANDIRNNGGQTFGIRDAKTLDYRICIDSTGRVGIGTISPTQKLDVDGAVNATTYYGDGSHLTGISGTTDNDWVISPPDIYTALAGKVGIGVTHPTRKLEVNGDVMATTYYGDGSHLTGISAVDDDWTISGGNVYRATGNVGIGTTSPVARLDVSGHINTNSLYEIGAAPVLSGSSFNQNIQVGHGAGSNNTATGVTLVGYNAGKENEGENATSVGWSAGYQSTGYGNTFIGASAGHDNVTGEHNTFVGHYAGQFNYSGSNNTFVGRQAGYDNINGDGNVFIGYQAGRYEFGSDKLYIANGPDTSDVLIYGDFSNGRIGLGTTNPDTPLHLESDSPMITLNTTAGNYAGMFLKEGGSAKWSVAYSPGDNYLFFYDFSSKAGTRMVLQDGTGNVGIGTAIPDQKLTVAGIAKISLISGPHLVIHDSNGGNDRPGIQFSNNNIHFIGGDDGSDENFGFYSQYAVTRTYDAHLRVHGKATSNWGRYIDLSHDGSDGIISTDTGDIVLNPAANVGIGTATPAYKLDVNGDINIAGSYNIKKAGLNYMHPDYVFEPDYELMPLDELKQYVLREKSLPNVISAEDVKNNDGFKMDELLVQMLEKIEEQTLYIFQLEERIAALEQNGEGSSR